MNFIQNFRLALDTKMIKLDVVTTTFEQIGSPRNPKYEHPYLWLNLPVSSILFLTVLPVWSILSLILLPGWSTWLSVRVIIIRRINFHRPYRQLVADDHPDLVAAAEVVVAVAPEY